MTFNNTDENREIVAFYVADKMNIEQLMEFVMERLVADYDLNDSTFQEAAEECGFVKLP